MQLGTPPAYAGLTLSGVLVVCLPQLLTVLGT
jgi:hypothetical protein